MVKWLLLASLVTAPAYADAARTASAALFAASEFSLAVDALQTLKIVRGPEKAGHRWESNPILGIKPSDSFILAYFGAIAAADAAAYAWAPRWASNTTSGVILLVEIPVVARNYFQCGIKLYFP